LKAEVSQHADLVYIAPNWKKFVSMRRRRWPGQFWVAQGDARALRSVSLNARSWPTPKRNLRFQELRDDVVAEQCPHGGF
jgi:hypothetical protein